jgi:hypothetical protein
MLVTDTTIDTTHLCLSTSVAWFRPSSTKSVDPRQEFLPCPQDFLHILGFLLSERRSSILYIECQTITSILEESIV